MIEIFVVDHTYYEFGYEKEVINASMIKFKVEEDKDFDVYVDTLLEYQKNGFLNV